MIVKRGLRPPNYAEIVEAFPAVQRRHGVIFAYGDTVYNPDGVTISPALIEHERVHSIRQGSDPASWWSLYISSPRFRLAEEIPAHRVEWITFCKSDPTRRERRAYLSEISSRLASALYGNLITPVQAKAVIKTAEIFRDGAFVSAL